MTVCIAALCQLNNMSMVIGASDRMLTVGDDTEYEPPQTKIYRLTDKAVTMIAGDTSSQTVIGVRTQQRITAGSVTLVSDMASMYAAEFAAHRRRSAEARILAPLGLELDTLFQTEMPGAVRDDLMFQLQRHRVEAASIVAGIDHQGPHVFSIHDPGIDVCQDREGFAAIGIGATHALSQFMVARYHPGFPLHEALLLVYAAKKRAEVAPGVGEHTDMFFIEPGSVCDVINPNLIGVIDAEYRRMRQELDGVWTAANSRMGERLAEMLPPPQPPEEKPAIEAVEAKSEA